MKKYILVFVTLLLAITTFYAFKVKETPKIPDLKKVTVPEEKYVATPTWYVYIGPTQSPADRKEKANYVRQTSEPGCSSGTINECAILLSDDFGPNATLASITFHASTGIPQQGVGDVNENKMKGL